jgi:DNA invertase Pin-like site-specific DNA recombinase
MGRLLGYSRCSTSQQDWAVQVHALTAYGVEEANIFREKESGSKRDRVELRRVLDELKDGDTLVVYRFDRLARSQLHLLQVIEEIGEKGGKLVSINDHIDTSTPTGKMLTGIVGALAELEKSIILERTSHGRMLARQRGVRWGRPPKTTPALVRQVVLAHKSEDATISETCRALNISRSTYYTALRKARADHAIAL